MKWAESKQNETLAEANKLVSSGQHKAAIDLLLDHLLSDSKSSRVMSALGRVYLLDRQPEKAAFYLKKALDISRSNSSLARTQDNYDADEFGSQDFEFLNEVSSQSTHEEYDFEEDEHRKPHVIILESQETQKELLNSTALDPIEGENAEKSDREVFDEISVQESCGQQINGDVAPVTKTQLLISDDRDEDESRSSSPDGEIEENEWDDNQDIGDIERFLDDDDELGFFETDEFEGDDAEDFDFLDNSSVKGNTEEALVWDDLEEIDEFDDLDEIDEYAHREDKHVFEDSVSRETRAKQAAADVLAKADWDKKHLSLLQLIFVENGWSACRISIEKAILLGVTPEMLALAREIRIFWISSEKYWISLQRIKTNARYQQADATYRHMSWQEAFRIIDCFPSLPDIAEVYDFIDECYEIWYQNGQMRKVFKVFFKFLKYRIGTSSLALPGYNPFYFIPFPEMEVGVDSPDLLNPSSQVVQELMEIGVETSKWPAIPENKIKFIEEIYSDFLFK